MSVRKRQWTTSKGETKTAWCVDFVDRKGERHLETFARKKDADARHATVKVDIRQNLYTSPKDSPTVKAAAAIWINDVKAGRPERATLAQYEQHLSIHILPRIGNVTLAQLTTDSIKAFRDDLLKTVRDDRLKPVSPAMARKLMVNLKSLLRASRMAHVADGVTIGVDKRGKRKLEVGIDIPTPGEVKRLVTAATDSRARALLLTACLCGLRASELRGLRWRDVDMKAGELHVRQRADRYLEIGNPKSASSRRTLPIDADVLLPALKVWQLACPIGDADLVFPTAAGGVEPYWQLSRSLAPVFAAAGVVGKDDGPKYGLHSLRHFFASWCLNRLRDGGRELPPKNVQELMGHSTIALTMDVYGHLFPRSDDRVELASSARAIFA
jgi:integrase